MDHALIPDPISHLIPDLIPAGLESERPSSAAERIESRREAHPSGMAGTPGILSELSDPPQPPTYRQRGGGGDHHANKEIDRGAAQPETESACLLRSIHAFPTSIAELADMPAELVGRVIAYTESEPGIESIPGWVIEALRRHRDEGWPNPAPRMRQIGMTSRDRPLDVEHYTSGAYGDLFRRGSDTSGLEDCFVEREAGAFIPPNANALEQASEESYAQGEASTETNVVIAEAESPAECTPPESADDYLTRQVQAELRLRCGRQRGRVIEALQIHVAGDAALIICATFADLDIMQREQIGALQYILARLGVPPQLAFTTRAGWEARKHDAGHVHWYTERHRAAAKAGNQCMLDFAHTAFFAAPDRQHYALIGCKRSIVAQLLLNRLVDNTRESCYI